VLGRVFEEENIYRIDHYLGKETVQNLLVFRFANSIFEPIWNRNYIDHVQLTAAETVGVEGRGGYYDSPGGGAMRDMIQSHLLQVMALIAMEPPVNMRADDIRMEKAKVLNATRGPAGTEVSRSAVRGQYGPGSLAGKAVPGYREEPGVDAESQTDTYAAMKVFVDTWRWGGVPFYLRSGKRMAKKLTEVVIYFKPTPHCLLREQASKVRPNQIVINVQPDEGIRLRFTGKVPGTKMDIKEVVMNFDYVQQFKSEPPEAYATLLLDAMRGDQTLFKHREEIESCWKIVQPTLDSWASTPQDDLPNYAAGTWGPSSSDIMMAQDGRHWHNQ
jgi:glucose-6-phosphate 1-dehydrogenase